MTSGPERSITGISIPKWMKTKISDRSYGFEESAFSPPTGDDGFFLIRYKKPLEELSKEAIVTSSSNYTPVSAIFDSKKEDAHLTKHTSSCQEFIPNAKISPREIGLRNGSREGMLKSTGIDDGFKGEGAACGYSVVAVAHQMIAEQNSGKDDHHILPKTQRMRRNSKSLPSSPLSSPKLLRRNPYFTSIFFGSTDKILAEGLPSKTNSVNNSSDDIHRSINIASIASEENCINSHSIQKVVKAKPSELREMNFWSPTSM